MSTLPATTDQDFIRPSFLHFEEHLPYGRFMFWGSQVLSADGDGSSLKVAHGATAEWATGSPGRSIESPSDGLLKVRTVPVSAGEKQI